MGVTLGTWLHIEPRYGELLARAGLDDLDALLAGAGGERVRHSWRTNVYRLELPGEAGQAVALYVKSYREPWPRRGYLFRASRALREWRVLRRLRRRGIPTPRPIAVGERRRWGTLVDAVLVGEEVPGSVDLARFVESFCSQPRSPGWIRRKHRYLEALARFTRSMHQAGFISRDFRWRDILIAEGEDGPRFYLIDDPRGMFVSWGWLARRLGVRDLAGLDRQAPFFFTLTDRLRFLRAYTQRPLRSSRRLLRRLAVEPRARVLPARSVRPWGEPVLLRRVAGAWVVLREAAGAELEGAGLLDPRMLLRTARSPAAGSAGGADRTLEHVERPGEGGHWLLRRSAYPGPLAAVLTALSSGRTDLGAVGREWRNLRELEVLRVPTPRWVAFAQARRWWLPGAEALLLDGVTGAQPLAQWLADGPATADRRAFAGQLGRLVARAHAGRYRFGVLSPEMLWVREAKGGPGPLFVDLSRGGRGKGLRREGVIRELAALAVGLKGSYSRTDALRFFAAYLGRPPTDEDKQLARSVAARYDGLVGNERGSSAKGSLRRRDR